MITAPLQLRRLGRSPVMVTELSLGGAAIGNLFTGVDDEAARAAIDAAWDGGIRTFDTAPHYGLGLSEQRLGDALRHRPRHEYVISTKVGRLLQPAEPPYGPDTEGFAVPAAQVRVRDYSADGVRRSLEASLRRLGLDRIDIALIHDPDDQGEQALREAYPALERLRDEGSVRAIGVGRALRLSRGACPAHSASPRARGSLRGVRRAAARRRAAVPAAPPGGRERPDRRA